MQQKFREDYPGEFVVLETRFVNGRKEQKREWIDNPITNHHISGRAAVIGSRIDIHTFHYPRLETHRGGLLGKKRLQTYVAGDIWKDFKADFAVTLNDTDLKDSIEAKYTEQNIVYTSASNCIKYPGEFYLIPFYPRLDVLALPIYLAAFDGHKEIFMMGYNNETQSGTRNWQADVNQVIGTYPGVQFIFVGVETNIPDLWRNNRNVRCMDYRKFVTYCDV